MTRIRVWLTPLLLLTLSAAYPAADLKTALPWEQSSPQHFTVKDGMVLADGVPMPLQMDFTWSAPEGEPLVRYQSQFGGTAHWRHVNLRYDGAWDFKRLDSLLDWCARHRLYLVIGLSVQQGVAYTGKDPSCAAQKSDGSVADRNTVSFMHEGYRQVLRKALVELAEHVRNKPYLLGYYPQDEFAYRAWTGWEPPQVEAFRRWVITRRGSLENLNQAWGTKFGSVEAIQPPKQAEQTLAWADWQEFRRFAQLDFARLVYQTLKETDPNHLVIWSLPFMGGSHDVASWWQFAPLSDVLMRHGIGYAGGIFRLKMLSAVGQWCGKPANALCMPPEYDASFVQMSFLMDGPRSGLSHVCTAGTVDHAHYMGSADPADNWRRREPLYTRSRSLNEIVRMLGPTFLGSKPAPAQVGVYVSDRQVLFEDIPISALNGMLQLLADLNLDTEIFSEHNWTQLKQYPAVVLGSFSRCATSAMADDLKQYVNAGGTLIMTNGAFSLDENGLPTGTPGYDLAALVGSREKLTEDFQGNVPVQAGALTANLQELPCSGKVSLRQAGGDVTVLADVPGKGALVTLRKVGRGQVLYFGMDPGLPYQAGYALDFAGFTRKDDQQIMAEQAGVFYEAARGAVEAIARQSHKRYGELVRRLLAQSGIRPRVTVAGYSDAIGAVKALSFRSGNETWIGLANRMVQPGGDHHKDAPEKYHRVLTNLPVSLALEVGQKPLYAVNMPSGFRSGDTYTALPELLPLSGGSFKVPKLADYAVVLLTPQHDPVLGVSLTPSRAVAGQKVRLTVRAVNPSPKALALPVEIEGSPGLVDGQKLSLRCAPGGMAEASCEVPVGTATDVGYETLQAVADVAGRKILSCSAEVQILPDVETTIAGADKTFFPLEEGTSVIVIKARNNRPEAGTLEADLNLGEGYVATPSQLSLALPAGQSVEGRISVTASEQALQTTTGELLVTTQTGAVKREQRRPIRCARGVVTYVETRPVRTSASEESRRPLGLVCLENRYLKAEFLPQSDTLHSLIPRHAGRDFLLLGDYPIGLVWYGLPGGFAQKELIANEREAKLVMVGGPQGKVTLTATLGREDRRLRIEYDCHDLASVSNTFYLMSHVSETGGTDTILAPAEGKTEQLTRGAREYAPSQLSASWTAVQGAVPRDRLKVAWEFPSLKTVTLRHGGGGWHYILFQPDPTRPPGKIVFTLSGDAEAE